MISISLRAIQTDQMLYQGNAPIQVVHATLHHIPHTSLSQPPALPTIYSTQVIEMPNAAIWNHIHQVLFAPENCFKWKLLFMFQQTFQTHGVLKSLENAIIQKNSICIILYISTSFREIDVCDCNIPQINTFLNTFSFILHLIIEYICPSI